MQRSTFFSAKEWFCDFRGEILTYALHSNESSSWTCLFYVHLFLIILGHCKIRWNLKKNGIKNKEFVILHVFKVFTSHYFGTCHIILSRLTFLIFISLLIKKADSKVPTPLSKKEFRFQKVSPLVFQRFKNVGRDQDTTTHQHGKFVYEISSVTII